MTGDDLREARRERGWSQREMARRAGIYHRAVQYWEAKPEIDPLAHAVQAMAKAHRWRITRHRTRARVHGVFDDFETALLDLSHLFGGKVPKVVKKLARRRVLCEARTRKGTPCQRKSEPGRRRCKLHGGMSTGPKTAEGRERIAEARREWWRRRRAERASTVEI